ncbi:unnamed protein product [Caenorhabditis auriculariae]|uniref:TFIID subunit TAF5 NTD2 domain-containing protein n=1 Tax=Caenorhabditis auriculariae TaxID=2777116 RepID=A0A8S1H6J7_9PELO|nr:unnamed protein product [Caenorhabditis auriculariae]
MADQSSINTTGAGMHATTSMNDMEMTSPNQRAPSVNPTMHFGSHTMEDLNAKQVTPEVLQQMLSFLRKNGFAEAEESLTREAMSILKSDASASTGLSSEDAITLEFDILIRHVESCCDVIQAEFSQLLFPVFAHCFIFLVEMKSPSLSTFFGRYKSYLPECYSEFVYYLSMAVDPVSLNNNFYAQTLKKNPFVVRMSKSCIKQLELQMNRLNVIKNIIRNNIIIEETDIAAKIRSSVETQMGGLLGQVPYKDRRHKMLYGVIKDELMQQIERRKMKGKEYRDNNKKMQQVAPQLERIPLPPISEYIREDKRAHLKEVPKMTVVSPESPVSICMYTTMNSPIGVSSCVFSDDSTLLAMGLADSSILVNSMDPDNQLKRLKDIDELEKIDLETAENVLEQMYEPESAMSSIRFSGHGSTVVSVDFSPDRRLLLSSSADKTVRLWSMDVQRNVVIYRTPSAVWDAKFCNRGYYFCTGSQDKTAAVWCTDRLQPVRLFTDSYSDVGCVDFHPNCNYIAGGSDDRYVRVWDISNGTCVRTFSGHKGSIRSVKFSPDGRYIVSGDSSGYICVWDLAYQRLCGVEETDQPGTIVSIAFTRDGGSFAVSHGNPCISLYSLDHLISIMGATANSEVTFDPRVNLDGFNFGTYRTKQSPVIGLHFSRRNLLMSVGCFSPN